MEAMGPEGALLSARLAQCRPIAAYATLESPREDPLYVIASAYAHSHDPLAPVPRTRPATIWNGLAARLRLPRARSASEIAANPRATATRLFVAAAPDRSDDPRAIGASLASLPLRWREPRTAKSRP
ncbi:MAG: hypothetical protein ACREDE_04580 [Thermoplasmata archaeon]